MTPWRKIKTAWIAGAWYTATFMSSVLAIALMALILFNLARASAQSTETRDNLSAIATEVRGLRVFIRDTAFTGFARRLDSLEARRRE